MLFGDIIILIDSDEVETFLSSSCEEKSGKLDCTCLRSIVDFSFGYSVLLDNHFCYDNIICS